jgi:competence protein ComEA
MWWKDFFFFSRSQRVGIRILFVLIFCMISLPRLHQWLFPPGPVDITAFRAQLTAFESRLDSMRLKEEARMTERRAGDSSRERQNAGSADWSSRSLHPFPFDPNKLPEKEWESMGLPDRLIKTIKNYEAAGGKFRHREDLQRIYLMREEWYAQLEPYIKLPSRAEAVAERVSLQKTSEPTDSAINKTDTPDSRMTSTEAPTRNVDASHASHAPEETAKNISYFPVMPVDINKADTSALMQIRGIGPAFSRRIVAYRELLGGFTQYEQLLEVYGLDSSRWEQVLPYLILDTATVKKINLNQAQFADLLRHPYVSRNLANNLISLRDQHGPFMQLNDIRQSFLVCDSLYNRIRPYITVE